jgi:hypothetical protein
MVPSIVRETKRMERRLHLRPPKTNITQRRRRNLLWLSGRIQHCNGYSPVGT